MKIFMLFKNNFFIFLFDFFTLFLVYLFVDFLTLTMRLVKESSFRVKMKSHRNDFNVVWGKIL